VLGEYGRLFVCAGLNLSLSQRELAAHVQDAALLPFVKSCWQVMPQASDADICAAVTKAVIEAVRLKLINSIMLVCFPSAFAILVPLLL
jgi:hypothetical protein